MLQDERGLTLTTESVDAVSHHDEAIRHFFQYRRSFGPLVKQVVEADPDFALGHCLRGYLFLMFATNTVHDKAARSLEKAEALAPAASPREQAHVRALGAWLKGDALTANAHWQAILAEHPHDILALRLQHAGAFWMGNNYLLRDGVAQVYPAWDEAVPGFGHVQGMLAFGLEECGELPEAERLGREAVERDPDDLWAIHAVAHVIEMGGRPVEGETWLDYPADAWEDRNPFRGHLWWHRALFLFDQGHYDEVLALYDRSIRTEKTEFYLDIQNQASLLLRLELQGIGVGERWRELADHLATQLHDHVLAFTEIHKAMALAGAGRRDALAELIGSLRDFGATSDNFAATTVETTTLPLCQAIAAFGEKSYARTIEILSPLRYAWARSGGSHAQRDIFHQILLEAAIRDGRLPLARALAAERITLKPESRGNWAKHLTVLEIIGDTAAKQVARQAMEQALS
jgi:tetratricopeptide (TPR) repeat protein